MAAGNAWRAGRADRKGGWTSNDRIAGFCVCELHRQQPGAGLEALTDAVQSAAYWGHSNVSDWQEGSPWEHRRTDGSGTADVVGTVLESRPPQRLVTTWSAPGQEQSARPDTVAFDVEPYEEIVRLTVTHSDFASEAGRNDAADGWPAVISNLKTFIELGRPLPQAPWEMPGRR